MQDRQFGSFHPLWMSFYSSALYRDVAKRWKGTGLRYLFLLVLIATLWTTAVFYLRTADFLVEVKALAAKQLPTVTIKDGMVSMAEPSPYRIMFPKRDETLMVIDTRDNPLSFEAAKTEILVTKTQVFLHKNHGQGVEIHTIPNQVNYVFDQALYDKVISKIQFYLPIAYFLGMFIISFIYRVLQAVVYVVFLKAIAACYSMKFDFDVAYRLALMVITPPMLLGCVLYTLSISLQGLAFLIYLFVTIFYLFFAVKSNQSKNPLEI